MLVVYGCAVVMEVVGVVQCCERGVEVVVVGVAQGRKELGVVR